MKEIISNYINERYDRWHDYSLFKCTNQGFPEESVDLLNEVLADVLGKEESFLLELYKQERGKYRGLDYYILNLISTYASSDTAPYRHKYRNRLPINANADWTLSSIADRNMDNDDNRVSARNDRLDEPDDDRDHPAETVEETDLVRFVFERLALTDEERCAFVWRFFESESLSQLKPKDRKKAYDDYRVVQAAIAQILKSEGLAKALPPKLKYGEKRVRTIVKVFEICHREDLKSKKRELKYILR